MIVSEGLVEMDPVKVSSVVEWPIPWNKKEVQYFVRFINFYQRFIKDFSHDDHACCDKIIMRSLYHHISEKN